MTSARLRTITAAAVLLQSLAFPAAAQSLAGRRIPHDDPFLGLLHTAGFVGRRQADQFHAVASAARVVMPHGRRSIST